LDNVSPIGRKIPVGTLLKRSLPLAISVVALTAISQWPFAAQAQTAAARNGGGQQQGSWSSPSSSFTGSQIGGFGGGNAGGGGFADPNFCGVNDEVHLGFDPSCPATTQNIPRSPIAFAGGAEYAQLFAIGPYAVIGWAVDLTGSALKSSGTQTTTHPFAGANITETLSTTQRQGMTSTLRITVGFVPVLNTLVFVTAGGAVGRISGSFSYAGTDDLQPPTTAYGAGSYSLTRFGSTYGGGVSFAYPLLGIAGTKITVEYLVTNLGTVTQNIPLIVTSCPFGGCSNGYAQTFMGTSNSTVRLKLSFGL
jgi:uncharacterized membrane protein